MDASDDTVEVAWEDGSSTWLKSPQAAKHRVSRADGAAVATSGRDRSLKVWDAAALAAAAGDDVAPAHAVETKDSPVFDVAWTPGNLCLASGPLLA